eukprot:3357032-Amphidinium_carterae.1
MRKVLLRLRNSTPLANCTLMRCTVDSLLTVNFSRSQVFMITRRCWLKDIGERLEIEQDRDRLFAGRTGGCVCVCFDSRSDTTRAVLLMRNRVAFPTQSLGVMMKESKKQLMPEES